MNATKNKNTNKKNLRGTLGFSMIELMSTVGIAAILATVGAPSLTSFMMNNRISAQTNAFLTDLAQARQEAVKLHVPVVVSAAAAGTTINFTQTNWSYGRAAYADVNASGAYDAGDYIIKVNHKLPGRVALSNADGLSQIQYRPNGTTNAVAGTRFTVCQDGYLGRDIVITPTGRAFVVPRTVTTCPGTPAS